jgi:uncharacterized protein (UPF0276 family)
MLETRPAVGWIEAHSENYLGGGAPFHALSSLRRDYPVSLHGVGLSLGTAGQIDRRHLDRVADLVRRIEPHLVSEHLSWSVAGGTYLNDLLPLPYTEESLAVFCTHVGEMQDRLGRQVLLENPSTYLRFAHSTIPEWEFLAEVAARSGCGILLDVNNIHVTARNHGFDAEFYLAAIPRESVHEIHLAGHSTRQVEGREIRIDDHGSAVSEEVWSLYRTALTRFGPIPTLIEWDSNIPELTVLLAEAAKAQGLMDAEAGRHDAAA